MNDEFRAEFHSLKVIMKNYSWLPMAAACALVVAFGTTFVESAVFVDQEGHPLSDYQAGHIFISGEPRAVPTKDYVAYLDRIGVLDPATRNRPVEGNVVPSKPE